MRKRAAAADVTQRCMLYHPIDFDPIFSRTPCTKLRALAKRANLWRRRNLQKTSLLQKAMMRRSHHANVPAKKIYSYFPGSHWAAAQGHRCWGAISLKMRLVFVRFDKSRRWMGRACAFKRHSSNLLATCYFISKHGFLDVIHKGDLRNYISADFSLAYNMIYNS